MKKFFDKGSIGFIKASDKNSDSGERDSKEKTRRKVGFISEVDVNNPFTEAATIKELNELKDEVLKKIEDEHNKLLKQGRGDRSKYKEEWDRFYKLYKEQYEKIRYKKDVGFSSGPPMENPFSEAKTADRLGQLWDREEEKLRERCRGDRDGSNYFQEWDKLYELYKEALKEIKRKEGLMKDKAGFKV